MLSSAAEGRLTWWFGAAYDSGRPLDRPAGQALKERFALAAMVEGSYSRRIVRRCLDAQLAQLNRQ